MIPGPSRDRPSRLAGLALARDHRSIRRAGDEGGLTEAKTRLTCSTSSVSWDGRRSHSGSGRGSGSEEGRQKTSFARGEGSTRVPARPPAHAERCWRTAGHGASLLRRAECRGWPHDPDRRDADPFVRWCGRKAAVLTRRPHPVTRIHIRIVREPALGCAALRIRKWSDIRASPSVEASGSRCRVPLIAHIVLTSCDGLALTMCSTAAPGRLDWAHARPAMLSLESGTAHRAAQPFTGWCDESTTDAEPGAGDHELPGRRLWRETDSADERLAQAITVSVSPTTASLAPGGTLKLTAAVTGRRMAA